jgi:hypothetical protein
VLTGHVRRFILSLAFIRICLLIAMGNAVAGTPSIVATELPEGIGVKWIKFRQDRAENVTMYAKLSVASVPSEQFGPIRLSKGQSAGRMPRNRVYRDGVSQRRISILASGRWHLGPKVCGVIPCGGEDLTFGKSNVHRYQDGVEIWFYSGRDDPSPDAVVRFECTVPKCR